MQMRLSLYVLRVLGAPSVSAEFNPPRDRGQGVDKDGTLRLDLELLWIDASEDERAR